MHTCIYTYVYMYMYCQLVPRHIRKDVITFNSLVNCCSGKAAAITVSVSPTSISHLLGPSTQYLRTLVSHTMKGMVFETSVLQCWVLGPFGPGSPSFPSELRRLTEVPALHFATQSVQFVCQYENEGPKDQWFLGPHNGSETGLCGPSLWITYTD